MKLTAFPMMFSSLILATSFLLRVNAVNYGEVARKRRSQMYTEAMLLVTAGEGCAGFNPCDFNGGTCASAAPDGFCCSSGDCSDWNTAWCLLSGEERTCEVSGNGFYCTSPQYTGYMESIVVTGVDDTAWTTVSLSETYVSPIAVCTVVYDGPPGLLPAVVRMKDAGPQSFQIMLQNPKGDALLALDVHCVVVEEGSWEMPDGRKIEANQYESTVTDFKNVWVGEAQLCGKLCSTGYIVLGQVMSYNDEGWSTFWSRGQILSTPPNGSNLIIGNMLVKTLTKFVLMKLSASFSWRRAMQNQGGSKSRQRVAVVL
jgi:hypothetical protein